MSKTYTLPVLNKAGSVTLDTAYFYFDKSALPPDFVPEKSVLRYYRDKKSSSETSTDIEEYKKYYDDDISSGSTPSNYVTGANDNRTIKNAPNGEGWNDSELVSAKNALKYTISLCVMPEDRIIKTLLYSYGYEEHAVNAPKLIVTGYQGTITPKIKSPTGNLQKGGIYRMAWTHDNDGSAAIGAVYLQYRSSGESTASRVNLDASAAYYDFDTSKITSLIGMEWRVGIKCKESGKTAWSGWQENTFTQASCTINDLSPTKSTYKGFESTFRWAFKANTPSGAIGVNIKQASAVLRWRVSGATTYQSIAIDSANNYYTMPGNVLPVGSVDWMVVVTANTGTVYESNWQSITNVEIPISVSGLYPDASGRAVKAVENRFGWAFCADDDDAPGEVTQASAILYWRNSGSGSYNQIAVSEAAQFADIPAGTFTGSAIEWYVKITAITGSTATSEVMTVSTLDTLSTPAAIEPVGVYVDDANGLTFTWQHINATNTWQTGWEISVSTDYGATFTVKASGSNDTNSWTSGKKVFPIGTLYWRVRTKNTDGTFGSYSALAIISIRRMPEPPAIIYTDNLPLTTIKWQSDAQVGYEVELDGESEGWRYGTEKEWRSKKVLEDGPHTVRVRIRNKYEDVSDFAKIQISTKNNPTGGLLLSLYEAWAEVRVSWEDTGELEIAKSCVLRDGKLIAVLDADVRGYTDRTCYGKHEYMVRAFDANGNYTDTHAGQARPNLPYAAIGLLEGEGWSLLKWSESKQNIESSRMTAGGGFTHLFGHEGRIYSEGTGKDKTVTLSYIRPDGNIEDLEEMLGKTVVYKNKNAQGCVGVFTSMPVRYSGKAATVTIAMTEVETEAPSYDEV